MVAAGVGVKGVKSPLDALDAHALEGVDPNLDDKTRSMIASKLGDVTGGDVGGGDGASPRAGRRLEAGRESKALD